MLHIALAPPIAASAPALTEPTPGRLRHLAGRFLDWRRRRATIATLHALDGRTLKDIGLLRSEIESAVNTQGADRRIRFADGRGR